MLLYLLYKWSTANHDYFAKLGLSYEKPLPIFGNLLNMVLGRESLIDITKRCYDKFYGSK